MVVADILRLMGNYEIVGFLDDVNADRHGKVFCGATVLGGKEQLDKFGAQGVKNIIVAIGNCRARLKLSETARQKGFSLVTAIHPQAVVAKDVIIGAGSVVMAGAIVNPGTVLGANVIVNTAASVDHECRIEDGAHLCPGVRLGGCVNVGISSWVGIGSVVKDHVKIGSNTVIGAGSVVIDDIPDNVVAYGVPAKVQRSQ